MSEPDEILGFGMTVGHGGRFVLLDKLGEGGMGEVWRAGDQELCEDGKPQVVALKFLSRAVRNDPKSLAFLRTEVLRSQRLSHPNIVRIFDLHMHKEMPFIKMEYVEGNSLRRWLDLDPAGLMPWSMVADLTCQLVSALEYAHRTEKIVHRDLKPANLLLSSNNVLKLSDFGISVGLLEPVVEGSNQGPTGTLSYASPQQLAGERPAPEDDIYALGSTLYELLTGSVPFYADSWDELIQKVKHETPQSIPARLRALGRRNEVPAKMLILVERCLAKNPLDRPKTHEIINRLPGKEGVPLRSTIQSAPPPQSESQWVEPYVAPRRARPWLTILIIAALVALAYWQRGWVREASRSFVSRSAHHGTNAGAASLTEGPGRVKSDEETPTSTPLGTPDGRRDSRPSGPHGSLALYLRTSAPAKAPFHFHVLDAKRNVLLECQTNPISLAAGIYTIVAIDSEVPPWEVEQEVTVEPGETTTANLTFGFGELVVNSIPPGATVTWSPGKAADPAATGGTAPFTRSFKAGRIRFSVSKRCYFPSPDTYYAFCPVRPAITNPVVYLQLRATRAPLGHETRWTNSLNMVFRRISPNYLACETETRVGEFRKFVAATGYDAKPEMFTFTPTGRVKGDGAYSWENPGPAFEQTDDHPVVGVSWDDARAFCAWLTGIDRSHQDKYLEQDMDYRLPSTNEWFRLGGDGLYPWGDDPTQIVGNYSGTEVLSSGWPACWPILGNYTDRFPRTAPVISKEFKPNALGCYHVGGNAAEWCGSSRENAVLCGGAWFDGEWEPEHNNLEFLQTRAVRPERPDTRDARNGFRVVLFDPGG